ncbi:MAG: ribosomal subunit interface protein [Elusimicrobia bacterium HGW-Elusimicrobia-4]|nr:MAG: ribosomal subunit interface protein [Elusimicrobia bacterium HGW-Elusimicrobia-4]
MIINVRAKRIKVPEKVVEYIKGKLSKSEKYFSVINKIEVFLSKQKYLYIVEIIINIVGRTIKIKQQAADFRSAVDIAVNKVEQQLRKEKERVKSRKKSFRSYLLEDKYRQAEKVSMDLNKRKLVPVVSSIDEVVKIMDDNDYMFWIFINKDTNKLSVIYEKSESNYGLFEIEKRR